MNGIELQISTLCQQTSTQLTMLKLTNTNAMLSMVDLHHQNVDQRIADAIRALDALDRQIRSKNP